MSPEELQARILYRDALMIVIDKPAGLPVHQGPRGGDNLESHFDALRFGLPQPPALAHRLDRDTSGCLILGRQRKGLKKLGDLFQAGKVEKIYWAVTEGLPPLPEGRIDAPLRKHNERSGWKMVVDEKGQRAITDYKILGRAEGRAWLELRPRTGRTHQIRIHLAHIGCPILGEPMYGAKAPPALPLHLHARWVSVPLYPNRPPVEASAEPPEHMRAELERLGYRQNS